MKILDAKGKEVEVVLHAIRIKEGAYYEPGICGSPAYLPTQEAIRYFADEVKTWNRFKEQFGIEDREKLGWREGKLTFRFLKGRTEYQLVLGTDDKLFLCERCGFVMLDAYGRTMCLNCNYERR